METRPSPLPATHAALVSRLGWQHTASLTFPGRHAAFASPADTPALGTAAATLLGDRPLYRHQALALGHHLAGRDVVIATGTGSGKSHIFHLATASLLGEHPGALTLALYPGKALAREQAAKWHAALVTAGLARLGDASVALITGDQPKSARCTALAAAHVAVLTPDVLHSWALAHLADRTVRTALARTRLVIVDEAHTLAGVFGSNTLHLFRRLQHALFALHAPAPRWIAASGTLAAPALHLETLVGRPFVAVTESDDTSARHPCHLHFIRPSGGVALSAGLQQWLHEAALGPDRFVAFTQSRKHTELLAVLANRASTSPVNAPEPDGETAIAADLLASSPRLAAYRSGLAPEDRAELQDRFARGELRGLVCTSAFELGIDLPGLDLGFLIGLPDSPASFWQRLGRFGRHGESHIFLLDDESPRTAHAFDAPAGLVAWRARDAALYPDNPILVARHALCLAHEVAALGAADQPLPAVSPLTPAMRELYAALQRGEPTPTLRDAQADQGNTQPPHLAFPLRVCEETYTFKGAFGSPGPTGFITYGQLLREAYPGGVYYHNGQAWRITRLNRSNRTLVVARERAYHTQPRTIPATLVPDLSQPAFADRSWAANGLRLIEARARATEAVTGFTELQGNRSLDHDYALGVHGQTGPLFRSYETTAMLLCHPALDAASPGTLKLLSALLREALILSCPREATELAATSGTLKVARRDLPAGRRFLGLYDTVPGSLRLTAALAEPAILRATLARAAGFARERFASHLDPDARALPALAAELAAAESASTSLGLPLEWPEMSPALAFARGTTALYRKRQLAVTIVRPFTTLDDALHYEVARSDDPAFRGTVAADALDEIPGTTEIVPLAQALAA